MLPCSRIAFVLAALIWMAVGATVAQEPPKEKPLTAEQQEKLKERDRYFSEANRHLKSGERARAIAEAEKGLGIDREIFGTVSAVAWLSWVAAQHEQDANLPAARKVACLVTVSSPQVHSAQ